MKTKPLTFLLALTFLFLFSGNSFGIDFGKSEEEKFKGTNTGVHLCRKKNLDILKDSVLRKDTSADLDWLKGEASLIIKECLLKHEKKADKTDWMDVSESKFSYHDEPYNYFINCRKIYGKRKLNGRELGCALPQFDTVIKNKSRSKIITYISILVKHKDSKGEPDLLTFTPWVLPGNELSETIKLRELNEGANSITFKPEERLDKELVTIKINEVRYVDFVLK